MCVLCLNIQTKTMTYCEIILFRAHKISWFDDDGQVRGHLNSWIFKLNTQLSN